MATFFAMPKLGLNMTEGHIVGWLVKEGAQVKAGQPIIEIETDKATNEVEAPASGIIGKILHKEGDDVPCNGVLAVILAEGEGLPAAIPAMIGEEVAPKAEVVVKKEEQQTQALTGQAQSSFGGRISISPSARKLAEELGVDLLKVVPSGNQVKREDVERAYQEMKGKPVPSPVLDAVKKPFTGIRKLTGEHLAQSVHTTARVALNLEVNVEKLIALRKTLEATLGKVSYNVLIAEMVGKALKEFPYMNSRLSGDEIWEMKNVNVGIAMNTKRGLLVPVLKDVDKKAIETLHQEFLGLSERALAGKSTPQDLEGGTFTITNLGAQEIESFIPVINLPECAILAVGAIMPKAVVVNEAVVVCKMMALTLVFDHRIVDGAAAAKFLQRIKHLLEEN
ncbi:MAG: 2-oxo acid dehydrogenase subunit E2 [Anaerolineaceae bacterium]|nr:2-oxo acid dehydrogenase subunit E2 [Anaerolineaceae bacterium]